MVSIIQQPTVAITQQPTNNIFIVNNQQANNIWNFENNWSSGFCNCFEDIHQCNFSSFFLVFIHLKAHIFLALGCFACSCWACFMCSLLVRMKENCCVFCMVPQSLVLMRTKARGTLKIRVCIKFFKVKEYFLSIIYLRVHYSEIFVHLHVFLYALLYRFLMNLNLEAFKCHKIDFEKKKKL